jgi:hypothetical protein
MPNQIPGYISYVTYENDKGKTATWKLSKYKISESHMLSQQLFKIDPELAVSHKDDWTTDELISYAKQMTLQ